MSKVVNESMDGQVRVVAAPHPFKTERVDFWLPVGRTVQEYLDIAQPDPVLMVNAHVYVGDQYVPRNCWSRVRPKAGVTITARAVPTGGGGGGKSPLRMFMMIAVMAIGFIVGPMLGATIFANLPLIGGLPLGLSFGMASTLSGLIGSAIISIAGRLLTNLIAPVKSSSSSSSGIGGSAQESPTLFLDGARNSPRAFAAVPVVLGKHRSVPPLGALSYTEVVGDDQFMRMLVVWGYGPLKIENLRIGDTPIASYEDVQIETHEGRPADAAFTLFPDSVAQVGLSVALSYTGGWQQRTSPPDADELSVDIAFARGLVAFGHEGERINWTVTLEIQYRKVGDSTWLTPSFTATTVPAGWISGNAITFTHQRSSAIRHGFRWTPSPVERASYEVRWRRTTIDSTANDVFDLASWITLRSITDEDPLNFPHPLAATVLVIRATDQLNRIVDELTADITSYVPNWNGSSWPEALSSNPASLFRWVLQCNALSEPMADARIDLAGLQDWHDFCEAEGFEFNMIRDFQTSVWSTLSDIALAGRASPNQVDGKWSIAVDEEQTVPVQHFGVRNSWGFEAEKVFVDLPHGFRIRFTNREQDWRQDERRVFDDGYNEGNATKFEQLDAFGITDPDQVWKMGRFNLAQLRLRPELWTFNADLEHIIARRGDLVTITHEVLLVGTASGRIKALQWDAASPPSVTGMTVDEELVMTAGTWGVSIRTVDNAALARQLVTDIGSQTTVVFSTPIPEASAPVVGDLFGFGTLGSETIEGLLLSIEPHTDMAARLTVVPHSPAVYDSDTGDIPAFDTKLTPLPVVPDVTILGVRSDESVLELGAGNTLLARIAIMVASPDGLLPEVPSGVGTGGNVTYWPLEQLVLEAQIRASSTGEPWLTAPYVLRTSSEITLSNVEEGSTYDLRVRWNKPGSLRPGAWATQPGHTVIGQTSAPAGIENMNLSVFGGSVILRWDPLPELDVKFGGEVRFRHSPVIPAADALWQNSTSIGTAASGSDLIAQLPLKPGTYFARVYDRGGRPSDDIAKLDTKQASVLSFANVDSVQEDASFAGVHTNTIATGGLLQLLGSGLFDAIPDLDLMTAFLDSYGGIEATGTYDFAQGIDLITVKKVRLTSLVRASSVNVLDNFDDRTGNVDDWEDWDGTVQAETDARLEVRHTDDDPSGSPVTWSAWNTLDSAEFETRGFDFRIVLTSANPAYNIHIDQLRVTVEDVP